MVVIHAIDHPVVEVIVRHAINLPVFANYERSQPIAISRSISSVDYRL